ncbi:Hsp70 family protein [Cyanobium sp. FGCU-52]|nr:Hsp70 family protein [Cyanobium sp. FGCU52]
MPGTLAIDLGSTTTVVAWQERGEAPRLLPLAPFSLTEPCVVPSLLWLASPEQSRPLIGRQVLEAGLADRPGPGLSRDFKRAIGAGRQDGGTGWLTPEQAGSLLLQRLWQALPEGIVPERLVLTAPIETYRGYRSWLQETCQALPVPELALVDEPTAAAIGAGLPSGSTVLVVDLGGGTIDLSLVALEGGEGKAAPIAQLLRFAGRDLGRSGQALRTARVIGKAGLPFGGRDIDRWIAGALVPGVPPDGDLLRAAERLKCRLSEAEQARELWSPEGEAGRELRLERQELERLLAKRGLLERLDELLETVFAAARRAGIDPGAIDAVLPVGGSSRIPLIRRWLAQRCPEIPLRGERPVEAVALGALALTPGVRVRDVLARGVSLRCWDRRSDRHHWHPLFVEGQSWPTEQPLELRLACSCDGQEAIELVLGEPVPQERGEVVFEDGLPVLRSRAAGSPRVEPWLAPVEPLPLQPPGHRGVDRLALRFAIDADGRLTLEVEDLEKPGAGFGRRVLGPVR